MLFYSKRIECSFLEDEKKIVMSLLNKLCARYNIKMPIIKYESYGIGIFTKNDISFNGFYNSTDNIITINRSLINLRSIDDDVYSVDIRSSEYKSVVIHEFAHYVDHILKNSISEAFRRKEFFADYLANTQKENYKNNHILSMEDAADSLKLYFINKNKLYDFSKERYDIIERELKKL